jgi:long-chain acyl-CoA synthetase
MSDIQLDEKNLVEKVFEIAFTDPARICLIMGDTKITYFRLCQKVIAYSKIIHSLGVVREKPIMVAATQSISFICTYLACHYLNIKVVLFDSKVSESRYRFICASVKPALIFMPSAKFKGSISSEILESQVEDVSLTLPLIKESSRICDIVFTSGTSGMPKGVCLSHENLRVSIQNINLFVGNSKEDVEMIPMPFSHSFGLSRLRCALYAGSKIILTNGVIKPKKMFEEISKHGVTGMGLVSPAWSLLYRLSGNEIQKYSSQLKWLEFGSAPMEHKDKILLMQLLPNTRLCMHYGLTEASRATFIEFHRDKKHLDSIGQSSPLSQIAIFDPDGNDLPTGETGEIVIRGGMVMQKYLSVQDRPASFYGKYFRSGDLGFKDDGDFVHLTGRLHEIINVGGKKIVPAEIEKALRSIQAIKDAVCYGIPDPSGVLGEVVSAKLVLAEGEARLSLNQIRDALSGKVENHMFPAKLYWVDFIPKTENGKIIRKNLNEETSGC